MIRTKHKHITVIFVLTLLMLPLIPSLAQTRCAQDEDIPTFLVTSNGHYLDTNGIVRVNAGIDHVFLLTSENISIDARLQPKTIYKGADFTLYVFKAPEKVGEYHIQAGATRFTIISDRIALYTLEKKAPSKGCFREVLFWLLSCLACLGIGIWVGKVTKKKEASK